MLLSWALSRSFLCLFAGSQWDQRPERYFGKVHKQANSQDAEADMEGYSSSDDGSDFSNLSQAGSASEDEGDELPFGPARTKADEEAPARPTETRPSMEDGDIEMGTTAAAHKCHPESYCMSANVGNIADMQTCTHIARTHSIAETGHVQITLQGRLFWPKL